MKDLSLPEPIISKVIADPSTAVATVASVFMIKHKELTRGDEEALRKANVRENIAEKSESQAVPHDDDAEMGLRDPNSSPK
ncbi:hypothetical protein C0989_000382 [Termitomyces sp. Mn162]|nr:hypothetical protein C0989_000382 [Termitomyces sp. Mn162]